MQATSQRGTFARRAARVYERRPRFHLMSAGIHPATARRGDARWASHQPDVADASSSELRVPWGRPWRGRLGFVSLHAASVR